MAGTTLIPDVLTALLSLLGTALDPLKVIDGPPGKDSNLGLHGVFIGATDQDNKIKFSQSEVPWASTDRAETIDIPNLLFVSSGSKGFAARRTDAFAYLDTIEATLKANPTLGLTKDVKAEFGISGEVEQMHSTAGPSVLISFTIRVGTYLGINVG